ncbi:MAG: HAD-IA family hydrolase [Chloroflexota bacterium]|nr:HAD-IA family hydrolase [Chloroflexota bacterium]
MALEIDAILFDLDGTLVDESPSYRETIRLTAEWLLGAPVSPAEVETIKLIPGLNNDWDATWSLIGQRTHGHVVLPGEAERGAPAYRRMVDVFQTYYLGDQFWTELSGRPAPFGWAEPLIARETSLVSEYTLGWLSTFPLGIATSRPRIEALMALRQHGLDRWFAEDLVVAAEDAPHEKPHPAPLQLLAARLGCRQAVYVGDTINDVLAAEAAGMAFILVGDLVDDRSIVHRVATVNEMSSLRLTLLSTQRSQA